MNIPIILGTARKGRQSEKVAKFILERTKSQGIKSKIIDVRDYRLPATDNTELSLQAKKIKKIIQNAKAIIIVAPEYNHSYPGELKMMLDLLYHDYKGKPVGLVGVSSGRWGGIRVVEQLKLLIANFKMVPITELYFPDIENHPLNNIDQTKKFLRELKKS